MVGKFLNGYERVAGAEPAPGFDRWYAINGYADYFDFQVTDDGELREVAEYATDDLTREAIEFTAEAQGDDVPFFLWLSYNAPHTVLPEHAAALRRPCGPAPGRRGVRGASRMRRCPAALVRRGRDRQAVARRRPGRDAAGPGRGGHAGLALRAGGAGGGRRAARDR